MYLKILLKIRGQKNCVGDFVIKTPIDLHSEEEVKHENEKARLGKIASIHDEFSRFVELG